MSVNYLIGNAIEPQVKPTIICHIVNTVDSFGAGFVVAITKKWPQVKNAYHQFYADKFWYTDSKGVGLSNDNSVESKRSIPFMLGEVQLIKVEKDLYVANMVAQKMGNYKGNPPIRYEALRECLGHVADSADKLGIKTITGCRFGAGLAGGDWNYIEEIIQEEIIDSDLNMDIYDLPPRQPNDGFVGRIDFGSKK